MSGGIRNSLQTVNDTTGVATELTRRGYGSSINEMRGLASDDIDLYAVATQGASPEGWFLWVWDSFRSRFRKVDSDAPRDFGVNETSPTCLEFHKGNLLMIGTRHNRLYTLNTTTGLATFVMETDWLGDTAMQAMADHGGKLYAAGSGNDYLLELDTVNRKSRRIGMADKWGIKENSMVGMTSRKGKLFGVGSSNNYLVTIG